jgi:putative toxin-antitoxin system antitoxin component (TIGR02293 family)
MTEAEMSSAQPIEDLEIERTVELLGGPGVLKCKVTSNLDAHDLLKVGIPAKALKHLVGRVAILRAPHHGALEKAVGISLRTYQRSKSKPAKALSPEQSGKTWKFAELFARVNSIFGSDKEAEAWFERPAMALDQRKPIDMLSTPAGVELVEEHLTRLEYGVYT